MKQILIIIIILQAFVGYTQSSKVCNNFLGTDKNAWFTSSPTRYNDKLLYFSSTNFLTTKSEVTMHIVDTCGMGYKEVILPIKGINLGGVEIDDYGNILYFTEKYINDTTTYPVLLKFNLSGTVLLESKPVVFPYPSEKQPYTLEKVADGYIIGGFDTIYFDYSIGFVMKLDLQGNLIWFNKVFPLDYIPITSRLLPNGDIELLLVRSSALFIQNIYTVRYNKDGKFLSEKKSSTNTSSEEDYYSGYYKDGKWVIWGNTRFSYNYAQYHALMTILDEDLNIDRKSVV